MTLHGRNIGAHVGVGPQRRWLFRKLEIEIDSGQIMVIVGPNGSGKTTLVRCLTGLRACNTGDVTLDGQPIRSVPGRERARRVAFLPQQTPLFHDLEVRDVVMLGRAPHLGRLRPPGAVDRAKVGESLAQVGVDHLAKRRLSTLSGGERRRVMLARMLATESSTLVLDEPTSALDIGHALGFLDLCRTLAQRGQTLVMALHDLELARRYADQVLCLSGDGEGHVHQGASDRVLIPEVLGPVFGVDARLGGDGLVFYARRSAPANAC